MPGRGGYGGGGGGGESRKGENIEKNDIIILKLVQGNIRSRRLKNIYM
jgi:hypothetical protein